jgi:hypothetical protein
MFINSQCNFCGQDEDYLHYFMSCPYLKEFWVKIQQILKKSNIENFVTLKHAYAPTSTHIHMHAYIYIYTMHTYLHFNIFPYFC